MAQPAPPIDAIASASPAQLQSVGQSIERDQSEDVMTDNGEAATQNSTPKAGTLSRKEHERMRIMVKTLSDFKDEEGNEIFHAFKRMVNKRSLPEYYEIIKFPTALSTANQKALKFQYLNWKDFVLDLARIAHNAQVYNRPSSRLFHVADEFRNRLKIHLQELVDEGIMTAEDAVLPDLGPLPESEDSPPAEVEEEVEDEEEEEEEEDTPNEDSDDSAPKKKRGRGRPRLSTNIGKPTKATKANSVVKKDDEDDDDPESRKKRGRPPKMFTPLEGRINNLLKGLRKFKHDGGELKILHFEKLPDKTSMPEYYQEVKVPMALDLIKKKAKRKKYSSVDAAVKDLDLMFENAKSYNLETSQVYKDAVDLQAEAHVLAEQEKNKADSEFMDDEGRIPLPEVMHNGELWKIGDWVHIQNPNDLKLPIVAQIYRTWQDKQGQKFLNACWYFRPEQTVHRHDKHFYEHEVVKVGQYRTHQVDEIVDRCFVMFITRYHKGRPRGFPADKQIYVCESRYNEDKHQFNKIKTWASCIPDEVRDKDYEMDLYNHPRKLKKVLTPIAHYLRDDAKDTDPLPKPNWGAANAPPIMGAVHNRPREEHESPPPMPTPSPPPQPPPQPEIRRLDPVRKYDMDTVMSGTGTGTPSLPPSSILNNNRLQTTATYGGQQFAVPPNRVAAPSPAPALARTGSYGINDGGTHRHHMPQSPHTSFVQPSYPHQTTPLLPQHTPLHAAYDPSRSSSRPPLGMAGTNSYNPPRPIEVFHLTDSANNAIPLDIREQFQRDEFGHVLFFTAPPLDASRIAEPLSKLGHSVKYLAKKALTKDNVERKRKERDDLRALEIENARKRAREEEGTQLETFKKLRLQGLDFISRKLNDGTEAIYEGLHGDQWKAAKEADETRLLSIQEAEKTKADAITRHETEREAALQVRF